MCKHRLRDYTVLKKQAAITNPFFTEKIKCKFRKSCLRMGTAAGNVVTQSCSMHCQYLKQSIEQHIYKQHYPQVGLTTEGACSTHRKGINRRRSSIQYKYNTNKIWLHAKVSPKTNRKRGSNTVTRTSIKCWFEQICFQVFLETVYSCWSPDTDWDRVP